MSGHAKVAVITGAASGIGLALTKACLKDNMHVVMVDIATENLAKQVQLLSGFAQGSISTMACDVTRRSDVEQLAAQVYQRHNQVDLLLNNAGIIGHLAPFWEMSYEQARQVIEVNLFGVIHGVQVFLPYMLQQTRRAHIVNMSSLYGLCSGSQMAPYAMSKHGVVALSESLFFDLKRLNKPVDISVVCPSFVNTSLMANAALGSFDKLHQMMSGLMERSRPAEDIADCILREIKKNTFYILPDKEVKDYCEQRTQAIINQTNPHQHSIEKIISSLSQRAAQDKRT